MLYPWQMERYRPSWHRRDRRARFFRKAVEIACYLLLAPLIGWLIVALS